MRDYRDVVERSSPCAAQRLRQLLSAAPVTAPAWVPGVIAWRPMSPSNNKMKWDIVPNVADVDNRESLQLAAAVMNALGGAGTEGEAPPTNPGALLETH